MSSLGHRSFEAQCRRRLPKDAGVRWLADARQHGRHSVPVPLPFPVIAVVVVLTTDFCAVVLRFISSRHGDVGPESEPFTYGLGLLLALFPDRGFDTNDDNDNFIVSHLKTVSLDTAQTKKLAYVTVGLIVKLSVKNKKQAPHVKMTSLYIHYNCVGMTSL